MEPKSADARDKHTKQPIICFYYGTEKPVLKRDAINSRTNWNEPNFVLALNRKQTQVVFDPQYNDGPHTGLLYMPDRTFATSILFGADEWTMRRMATNPELYGEFQIDPLSVIT